MSSMQEPKTPKIKCLQHPTLHVNSICIINDCKQTRISCDSCKDHSHFNHQLVPLHKLINSINRQAVHQQRQHHFKSLIEQLQQSNKSWLRWIQSTRKTIETIFQALQTKITDWFANMQIILERCLNQIISPKDFDHVIKGLPNSILKTVNDFRTENKCDQVVGSYRKSLSQRRKKQFTKLDVANDKLQSLLLQYLENTRILNKQIQSILTKHRFGQTVDEFHLLMNFGTSGLLAWDPILKHKDISIMKGLAYRHVQTTEELSVSALLDIQLYTNSNETRRWGYRIVEKSLYIAIGICLESQLKQNGFQQRIWDDLGHGLYLNDSAGGTYSHSDPEVNHKVPSFGYDVGDIIHVQFDPIKKLLTFVKNWKEQYHMTIEITQPNDCYRPCVYFSKPGDCVEIVESK